MKIWNNPYTRFVTIAIVAFLSSCTLDDPTPTDQSPPLTLTTEQNLSLTTLSWDRVNVTGFKEYILLQSSSSIPDNPAPVVNQDVTVVKKIKDVDETSLSVSPSLITPNVWYKLYCSVDDRFLYSPTICVQQNIDFVLGFFDAGCHTPGIDEMVLFDRTTDDLATINYKTSSITKTVNDFGFSFPSLDMSEWNGSTDVFGFDQSPPSLRKFNYPSLSNTHNIGFNQVLWAVKPYHEFVFIASEEFGQSFKVLRRNNLTDIDKRVGITNNQNIAVFPGDPLIVITFGVSSSKKYTINAAGKVLTEEDISTRLNQANLQNTCAQGNELFIADVFGSIFNRDGEKVGALSTNQNTFIQMIRLSPDEKKAIFLANENGIQRLQIADLSNLSSITLLKSFDLPSLNYADIIPEEEIIYVVGSTFNSSQSQTYFLKYPL
jgi:hypothetical protein